MPDATLPGATLAWVVLAAAALLALGAAATAARARKAAAVAGAVLALSTGVTALAYLVAGAAPARLDLPVGLAGVPLAFALDGMSALFLLAIAPAGALAVALGPARALPVLGAAIGLILAAQATTLVLAVAALAVLRPRGGAGPLVAVIAVLALGAAVATLPGAGSYAAMRVAAAEGAAAWMVPVLVALGWAGLSGAGAREPSGDPAGAALAAGIVGMAALSLPLRLLVDLGGAMAPAWWALPLLAVAAVLAVRGAVRAVVAMELAALAGAARQAQAGLAGLGIAMALAARAVDDGPATGMALGAVLFGVVALGWQQALLALIGSAVARGAGTTRLDRLGGLARGMRFTTAGALVAGFALAMVPPGPGFAGGWMLAQAAVLLPRGGGLDWWAMGTLAMAALALTGGLLTAAAVRWIGVGFLGRPRTPRAAAAEEMAPGWRWTMLLLSAVVLLCGVVPGLVLWLAAPAMRMLAGGMGIPAGLLAVAPGPVEPGYAAPAVALLLGLAVLCLALLLRARPAAPQRAAPAWDGGQGPAPAWLPFGDPETQVGPQGFAQPLLASLGFVLRRAPRVGVAVGGRIGRAGPFLLGLGRAGGPWAAGVLLAAMLLLAWVAG